MVTGSNSGYLLRREAQTPLEYAASHLSVQLDPDAVAWAVTEKKSAMVTEVGKEPIGSRNWSDLQQANALQEAFKTRSYQSVSLALRGMPFTLVPQHLFDPARTRDLLQLTTLADHSSVVHEAVASINAVVVMSYPDVLQPIIDMLPVGTVWSNARLLIDAVVARHRSDERAQIYADISTSFTEVYIVQQGVFQLANVFQTTEAEDVLYHVSNCARQLNIDHSSAALNLSGDIQYGSEAFKLYRDYHPEVNIHFGFTMPRVDIALGDLRKQSFMSLLNQFQCVS